MADLEKHIKAAQNVGGTSGEKLCLVTVIGTKLNGIVQDIDCPPFTVYTTDARSGIPTDAQRAECIRLWAENRNGPSTYEFPENGWPDLQKELDYQARRSGRLTPPSTTTIEENNQ